MAPLNAAHLFNQPIGTCLEDKPSFFPAVAYRRDFLVENPRTSTHRPPRRQGAQAFDARAYKVFVAHLGAGAPHRAKMAATLVHEDSEYMVNF